MKLTTLLGFFNSLANSSMRWLEPTTQESKSSPKSAKKSKIRPAPFINGRGELKADRPRAKLDNPNWVYTPAASTDIRKTIHKELSKKSSNLKVFKGGA